MLQKRQKTGRATYFYWKLISKGGKKALADSSPHPTRH